MDDRSKKNLATADERLARVVERASEVVGLVVTCGHRGKADQDKAFATGRSKVRWPASLHNCAPSRAVDLAPTPIDWKDRDRFILLAGVMLGVAHELGIKIRWGGDWNDNRRTNDERFIDLPHFELHEDES